MLNYAESFQRSVRNELLAELQSGALLMSDGVRDLHTALISCILINFHYGCCASSCSLCVSLATEQTTFLGSAGRSAGAVRCRRCLVIAPYRSAGRDRSFLEGLGRAAAGGRR